MYEKIYKHILKYELLKLGLSVRTEVSFPLIYDSISFDIGFKIDLLVNEKVIVELKSVEQLSAVHHKQLITYLRLTDLKLGILINFNTESIKTNIFRKVNNLQL